MSSQPISGMDPAPAHETPPEADQRGSTHEVVELAQRLGCRCTLQIGGRDLELATALAQAHAGRTTGRHDVIAREEEADAARANWSASPNRDAANVRLLGGPLETALSSPLGEDAAPELVVIEHTPRFEQLFLEFLLVDRRLAPGATVVLMAAQAPSTRALVEFINLGRAYERRSPGHAATVMLRKLGRQLSAAELIPRWGNAPQSALAPDGVPVTRSADHSVRRAAFSEASVVDDLSARLRYVERLLVDAEQRAGEVVQLRGERADTLRGLAEARAARDQTEFWLIHLQQTASWRLTSPLRWVTAHLRR
jgi:hypothetical protein